MKTVFVFCLSFVLFVAVGSFAASNKINWLTQIFSPGATASGQLAAVLPNGNTAFVGVGANLSIDGSGNLNAASSSVNFAAGVAVTVSGSTGTLPSTPKSSIVLLKNGLAMGSSEFTNAAGSTSIVFATAPLATDNIQAIYLF